MRTVDCCIVGAGAVGTFLAAQLAGSGLSVVVLESGDSNEPGQGQLLGSLSNPSGHRGVTEGWTAGAGGTTQLWGGQLWPWRADEFEGYSHLLPAWPISSGEILSRYEAVASALGLSSTHGRIHSARELPPRFSTWGSDVSLRYSTWMSWSERNFARNRALQSKISQGDVTYIYNATVEQVDEHHGLREVVYRSSDASRATVSSRVVVLAAGTLGNTRILSANEDLPHVGDGFMDHVSARFATFEVADWSRFRKFAAQVRWRSVNASPRLVPSGDFLRNNAVLPAYGHWEFGLDPAGGPALARDYLRARQSGTPGPSITAVARASFRSAPSIAEAVAASVATHTRPVPKSSTVHLRVDVQQPSRDTSALRWRRSAASPLANLDLMWSVGAAEHGAAASVGTHVLANLDEREIGARLSNLENDLHFTDTFHLMGGTPMSASSDSGVVDPELEVHGMEGVFVAGASVFPTGGMANPTFTALALASRLGERIREGIR